MTKCYFFHRFALLDMSMNQPPDSICEQHVHLAGFNYRRYFSFAERWMNHGLAPAIGARAIIGRANLAGSTVRCARFVRHTRAAYRTTHAGDPSLLAN